MTADPNPPETRIPAGELRVRGGDAVLAAHTARFVTVAKRRPENPVITVVLQVSIFGFIGLRCCCSCFVCAVVGVLLVILPWRPEWTDNRLLLAYPHCGRLWPVDLYAEFCSGLGVLDIWIGFWEAVHYQEFKIPERERPRFNCVFRRGSDKYAGRLRLF